MKIFYKLGKELYTYNQTNLEELKKLNFLLTNKKGDFLNLGVEKNSTKFQGFNFCNNKTLEIYKVIENIVPIGLEVESVLYGGYFCQREFKSHIESDIKNSKHITRDRFYVGPTGGMIYEIENFSGDVEINLDCRKQNDFEKWGRNYEIYKENDTLFVKYTKQNPDSKNDEYQIYFGMKTTNLVYEMLENWIEVEYEYSKQRNSEYKEFIYNLLKVQVSKDKKLVFGVGLSEFEVKSQLELLEKHQGEIEKFDSDIVKHTIQKEYFVKPLPQNLETAYNLSKQAVYKFLNHNMKENENKDLLFAGFPWFSKNWSRDELISLKSLVNLGEYRLVKEKLFDYLNKVDNLGQIKRIDEKTALSSVDSTLWLFKRVIDFLFYLDEREELDENIVEGEIKYIYDRGEIIFKEIFSNFWDYDNELLKVKKGDSWMDTIEVNYPLDIQVQLLGFVSDLSILASMVNEKESAKRYLDFEEDLKKKIRNTYFRDNVLYSEKDSNRIDSNIFLSYYIYKDLFLQETWEQIFDYTLTHLRTHWGGISSLSHNDEKFKSEYTGENNESYHNGDSWFWINNLTALVLNDLNEKKYRTDIRKILLSSSKDILEYGTIGFASEISSASSQKSEGNLAQLWSSATFIELIESIFKKE